MAAHAINDFEKSRSSSVIAVVAVTSSVVETELHKFPFQILFGKSTMNVKLSFITYFTRWDDSIICIHFFSFYINVRT